MAIKILSSSLQNVIGSGAVISDATQCVLELVRIIYLTSRQYISGLSKQA